MQSAHDADLALAAACLRGEPGAVGAFLARFEADIARAAARASEHGMTSSDLAQQLAALLFVSRGAIAPKIAEYSGRAPLRAWVRVVLARLVVDFVRMRSGREPVVRGEDAICALEDARRDPESAYFKQLYKSEFSEAFRRTFQALEPEERNALRHRYVEGLGIDQIALAHGIHRASAARRVQKAEQVLAAGIRRRLAAKLRLEPRELESAMRMIRSDLLLSFSSMRAG